MKRFHRTAIASLLAMGLTAFAGPSLAADDAAALAAQLQGLQAQIQALRNRIAELEAQSEGADPDTLADLQAQIIQLSTAASSANETASWNRGAPEFRSSNGELRFRPRGRVVFDVSTTQGSDFDERNISGTEMRAVRLGAEGRMGALRYKVDTDFADQEVSVKDAWIAYEWRALNLPMELFLGNKLRERGIDASNTLVRNPFQERNAVAGLTGAVNSYYGLGTSLKVHGHSWHVGMSITGDDLDNTGSADDSIAYSVRTHWNPLKRPQGFVHLGTWYYYEKISDEVATINNIPRIGPFFNDNLRVSASSLSSPSRNEGWGFELAGVYRNFWATSEIGERRIGLPSTVVIGGNDRVGREAWAVSAGWLITGERPGFSTRSGVWGTTRVLRPVTEGGWGAFELAVRADDFDFTDAERGGDGQRTTLALNWYLNNHSRLSLNYYDWTTDNQVGSFQGEDSGESIALRAQVVF